MLSTSGGLLLRRPSAPAPTQLCGAFLTLGGLGLVVGALLEAAARPQAAEVLFGRPALSPSRWPSPCTRVRPGGTPWTRSALVLLAGAGFIAVVTPPTPEGGTDTAMFVTISLALIGHTWWRIERSAGPDRRALTWLALGAGAPALLAGVTAFAAPTTAGAVVALATFAALGPALVLGVAEHEVVDGRALVVTGAVIALTAITYASGFAGLVSALDLLGARNLPVGTLALIGMALALGVHPMRVMLRGVIDELLFGRRPDPLGAAAQVAGTFGGPVGADPETAVRAVRQALTVPYAAVLLDGRGRRCLGVRGHRPPPAGPASGRRTAG